MKIFCIGLNKTGTRSLHSALQILGFRSVHWGRDDPRAARAQGPRLRAAVESSLRQGRPLLDGLPHADAYSDILALSTNFDVLDRQYPLSSFILTVRDVGSWIESRRSHVQANIERKARGEYDGGFLDIDEEAWAAEMQSHIARVTAYFSDRPADLLVMNITAGDAWEVLCPFLGVPIPDAPFPRRS